MVIEVVTLSNGISLNKISISAKELIGTPARPTSPTARGWSESYPVWVGKSKATESPLCPLSSRNL